MQMERTFIAIKPDGTNRGLIGEIIARFEKKGYKLVAMKAIKPSKELAETHYDALKEKPFFGPLVEFICSGLVIAMVWEGTVGFSKDQLLAVCESNYFTRLKWLREW